MKHTPGPWALFKGYVVQANDDGSIPLDSKWICEIKYFSNDSREANARLIAAAPELLAALILITNELKGDEIRLVNSLRPGDQSLGDTVAWCRTVANTAIVKATGGVE